MSCTLRVDGGAAQEDALLKLVLPLKPVRVWRKGEVDRSGNARGTTAVNIGVSEADMENLPGQIEDAIDFLEKNGVALNLLRNLPGIGGIELDFGIGRRDVSVQVDRFPGSLVTAAGQLGIGLCMSRYE